MTPICLELNIGKRLELETPFLIGNGVYGLSNGHVTDNVT